MNDDSASTGRSPLPRGWEIWLHPFRARYDRALERAEDLVLDGKPLEVARVLRPVRAGVERLRGPGGPPRRARLQLAWGYCRGCAGSLDEAWVSFQAARREAGDVADPRLARLLRLRAQVELAHVALAVNRGLDRAAEHAGEALREADGAESASALARLAQCLVALAQAEHAAGRWEAARAHYEAAVTVGMRVAPPGEDAGGEEAARRHRVGSWVAGRTAAATAALEVARTLATLGETEGCREWFERAFAALQGPEHALVHHARAVLSLERARCESDDDVGGPTRRVSWFEAAVREGRAGGERGLAVSCRAGLDLAAQLRDLGDNAGAAARARAVIEALKPVAPEPATVLFDVEARLALGVALLDAGEEEAALAALRESLERGRAATAPDARRYAAVAAWRLHGALLGDRRIAEAGEALAALKELVPGLAPEHRPFFVALMSYLRGMTCLCEGRHDEAREELERAEAGGRRLEGANPDLVRSAAAGLGSVALECESWDEAQEHFRRALATPLDRIPPTRQQAVRADLLLGMARAVVPTEHGGEALALVREAFQMGLSSGCSMGRKVAAHAALIEGDAPMLETAERRRLYQTAARLGHLSGLAQGRAIAAEAEARLVHFTE